MLFVATMGASRSLNLFTQSLRYLSNPVKDTIVPGEVPLLSDDLPEEDEEFEEEIAGYPAYLLLEGVISRCVYFLSLRNIGIQVIVLCILYCNYDF